VTQAARQLGIAPLQPCCAGSTTASSLDRVLILGEAHLRSVLAE